MRKGKTLVCAAMAAVMMAGAYGTAIMPVNPVIAEEAAFDEAAHGSKVEEGSCSSSIKYTLYSDGTLYIYGNGKMKDYQYSSITPSPFENNARITGVYINSGISYIGSETFYGCSNLKEITIPDTVSSIGGLAFEGTGWLDAQRKKNPLVCYGKFVLDGRSCKGSVSIPDGITKIAERAFEENKAITDVKVPSGVTHIGKEAFYNCSGLNYVQLPDTVKTVDEYAFGECGKLISVNLPDTLSELGEGAFAECTALTFIKIPTGIKKINPSTFYDCKNLSTVSIPGNVSTIDKQAFYSCMALKTVVLESGVRTIKEQAFTWCDALKDIAIPASVMSMDDAFFDWQYEFTIHGDKGSTAEVFAKKEGLAFSTQALKLPDNTPKKGDVDGNGTVNLTDARMALRTALNLLALSDDMKKRADTDGDTFVTLKDARQILRISLHLE